MRKQLAAIAVLAAGTVSLVSIAAAGSVAAKQRVAIQVTGANQSFVLTPLTSGAVKPDTGIASFCCWSTRHVMRDGQAIDVNDPQMTLTGKRGTLVLRNRIEWVDIPAGVAIFTGTWKVIRGTGAYAGLSGGGRGAGVTPDAKSRFEGFLSPK